MDYLLPATTYQPPPRPARMSVLNTIIEDLRESHFEHERRHSSDEETVIGIMDAKVQSPPVTARRIPPTGGLLSPMSESCSGTCESEWRRRSDIDDLYEVSDDETEFESSCPSLTSSRPTSVFTDSTRNSHCSVSSRNRYPSILIPSSHSWHATESPKKTSPVPPTPPPKIPVSPAALLLLPRSVPSINAPPSLDGSSMSEQNSNLSAPPTPAIDLHVEGANWGHPVRVHLDVDVQSDVSSRPMTPEIDIRVEDSEWGSVIEHFPQIPTASRGDTSPTLPPLADTFQEGNQTPSECGVLLASDALDTLRHLSLEFSPEPESEVDFNGRRQEMREGAAPSSRPRSAAGLTPASAHSEYSFTSLSIPSPGGFFSSLGAGARHTWCPPSASAPPSSTTAEHFYNCPWNAPEGEVVEQIVEVDTTNTEGPPTARQIPEDPPTARRVPLESRRSFSTVETVEEIKQTELTYEYDDTYESELTQLASANLDRTSVWLAAQASYLSALRETNPVNDLESSPEKKRLSKHERDNSLDSPVKKIVRFLEDAVVETEDKKEVDIERKDSTYYRGFQHVVNKSKRRDSFTHSSARYDAVQTSRICQMDTHVDQLLGKFEPHEPKRPTYSGPFSQRPPSGIHELTPQQKVFDRVEREQVTLDQMTPSMWAVEALKYLNGGKLIPSPGAKRLAKAAPLEVETTGKNRVRVLDLGGQPSCDWAWHCATEFRNVKTYTVITKQQVANHMLKGPRNHRQVSVPHLWELPFPDAHFDVISARSLHAVLKAEKPMDMNVDEYDLCLKECLRCLKPGGYLEFLIMDSEITHAGPRGSAASVEFGFNLKTRGYDPTPTKAWLGKLRRAGFVNMKRAWMFLPMGCETRARVTLRETPSLPRETEEDLEAVQGPVGSTSDIANVSGLLGSWMWEQWMLKVQLEMGRDREHLLEGVAGLIEEGRNCNAGWRCLSGWARKPRGKKEA